MDSFSDRSDGISAARPGDLLQRLLAAEEQERGRLARVLHDRAGQNLTACRLLLPELLRADDKARSAIVQELRALTSELAEDLHRTALAIRAFPADAGDLAAILETYVGDWSAATGTVASVHLPGLRERLPSVVAVILYRVVQQALWDVFAPKKAAAVSVVAEAIDGTLSLIIEEEGGGADVAADAPDPLRARSVAALRDRAAIIGAEIHVESGPGGTMSIYVRVPLARWRSA